jgi:hypothetical protein
MADLRSHRPELGMADLDRPDLGMADLDRNART